MPVQPASGAHYEEVTHFNGIRLRVTGVGNLDIQFQSLDNASNQTFLSIPMTSTTGREPTRLVNFITQRGLLKISTDQIDENFKINRILIFTKPLWSQYPS
jgi:hypothetical protein